MSTEIRCVSGLHAVAFKSNCMKCKKIRNTIWNSPDPRGSQMAYNETHANELASAAIFKAAREQLELSAAIAQLENAERLIADRAKGKQEDRISAMRARSNNMRAKRIKAEGLLSNDLLAKLHKLQKGKCPCCKKSLGDDFHMDHIVPLAKGGTNTDDNIQLLRDRCNLKKSTMDPILFMQVNGFLI